MFIYFFFYVLLTLLNKYQMFCIKPSFPWLTVMVKKQLNILTSVAHTMTKILYILVALAKLLTR